VHFYASKASTLSTKTGAAYLQLLYAVSSAFFVWDLLLQVGAAGMRQYLGSMYNLMDLAALATSGMPRRHRLNLLGFSSTKVQI
jgi:hypothetical protein